MRPTSDCDCQPCRVGYLTQANLAPVMALEPVAFAQPWGVSDWMACLVMPRSTLGIFAGLSLVGAVVFRIGPGGSSNTGCLLRLIVLPKYRRLGYGSILLAEAEAEIRDLGANRIVVDVDERNLAGQLFLRANNWRATRVHSLPSVGKTFYRFKPLERDR